MLIEFLKNVDGYMRKNNSVFSKRELLKPKELYAPYLFLSPALLLLIVFFFIPVFASFIMSFTDFDIYSVGDFTKARFTGLENYKTLLNDPIFWKAFGNTTYFVFIGGPLTILVSTVL